MLMLIDARQMDSGAQVETGLCIIGGGAAGITLALEFARQGVEVCLLEGGGLEADGRTQSLQSIANIGRKYYGLRFARPRYYGGATNVWGGHCVPLRAVNFERVPWIPYSGWPFRLDTIVPYYARAHQRLSLGAFDYRPEQVARELGLPLFPFASGSVETVLSRYLGPTRFDALRFGAHYRAELAQAANLVTYLHANVTAINQDPGAGRIKDVSVATLTGRRFTVRARQYVLAAGGIENARLLLLSDQVQRRGLGNQRDLVGRFFMEHIWYRRGRIQPRPGHTPFRLYGAPQPYRGAWVQCHLALAEAVVRQQQIPDFRAEIAINAGSRFEGLLRLAHQARERIKDFEALDAMAFQAVRAFQGVFRRLDQARVPERGPVVYQLANYVEQVPNPDSRVQLSDARDALGLRKAVIDWRLSALDREGIRVAHRLLAQEVERSGFGRMDSGLAEDQEELLAGASGGGHHMGTTRMSADPRWGVVDGDGRVYGLDNLFVAGSSVFPTGGFANPTLTIMALAIRLADHLKRLLAQP